MSTSNLDCHVCNKPIEGEVIFGCSYSETVFEDGAYSTLEYEPLTSICLDCIDRFDILVGIATSVHAELSVIPTAKRENNIVPIHSHYECSKCSEPIPNGAKVISLEYGKEIWRGSIITPLDVVTPFYILCSSCGYSIDLRNILSQTIVSILVNARKAYIRSVNYSQ